MKEEKYFQAGLSDLEYETRQSDNSKYYFSPDTKRFFGSKINRDDVFANEDKTKYIWKERLTNAPPGGTNVKISQFDKKTGNVTNLYAGTDTRQANKVLKDKLEGWKK